MITAAPPPPHSGRGRAWPSKTREVGHASCSLLKPDQSPPSRPQRLPQRRPHRPLRPRPHQPRRLRRSRPNPSTTSSLARGASSLLETQAVALRKGTTCASTPAPTAPAPVGTKTWTPYRSWEKSFAMKPKYAAPPPISASSALTSLYKFRPPLAGSTTMLASARSTPILSRQSPRHSPSAPMYKRCESRFVYGTPVSEQPMGQISA